MCTLSANKNPSVDNPIIGNNNKRQTAAHRLPRIKFQTSAFDILPHPKPSNRRLAQNKRVHWQGNVSGSGLEQRRPDVPTPPPPLRQHLAICHLTDNEQVHLNPASTHYEITSTLPFV